MNVDKTKDLRIAVCFLGIGAALIAVVVFGDAVANEYQRVKDAAQAAIEKSFSSKKKNGGTKFWSRN